jgi:serine/threonine protein kinase
MIIENKKIGTYEFSNQPIFVGNTSKIHLSLDKKYSLKIPFTSPCFTSNKNYVNHYRGSGSEWILHIKNSIYEDAEKFSLDTSILDYSLNYLTQLEKRYKIVEDNFRIKSFGLANIRNSIEKGIVLEYHDAFNMDQISYHENKKIWYSIIPGLLLGLSKVPHGDLNPDNILVDKNFKYLHLIDPGIEIILESKFSDVNKKIILSRPFYYPILAPSCRSNRNLDIFSMHPEDIFTNESSFNNTPDTADLIATGIMYYVAATGRYPFKTSLKKTPLWHFEANLYREAPFASGSCLFFNNWDIDDIIQDDTIFKIKFNGLIHKIYEEIEWPSDINPTLSHDESTFIINLLYGNKTTEFYIDLSKKILNNIA